MNKLSVARSGRVNTISPLRILIMLLAIFMAVLAFFAHITSVPPDRAYRVICQAGLKTLGISFMLYAEEFDGNLPRVESWCDALGKYIVPESLICRSSNAKEGQSSYAMNKFLDGRKLSELPANLVLLFESKLGWNIAGGPEILTMEHHEGGGCNVLFVDGDVKFLRADEISKLKWTVSESDSNE